MTATIAVATRNCNELIIPSDWPFEHIPVPTYDEDEELEDELEDEELPEEGAFVVVRLAFT